MPSKATRSPERELFEDHPSRAVVFSFSGHETFVFRYGWLKKAVDAVIGNPRVFQEDDAIVTLGVGRNMVRSIRHWGLATRVLEEEAGSRGACLRPTELGTFLFGPEGRDPYLEDPNSLWLLHWSLVSNESRSTTWHWAFHKLWFNEFTRDSLLEAVQDEIRRLALKPISEKSLHRDIEVFLRTYVPARSARGAVAEDSLDCPLTELRMIEQATGSDLYEMRRGPKGDLSDLIFAFVVADFWEQTGRSQNSLAFSEIAYAKGGPGNAFKFDENALVDRLDRLETVTEGAMSYIETAGLKQVYRKDIIPKMHYLHWHYHAASTASVVGV